MIEEGLEFLAERDLFNARQRFVAATTTDPRSATAHYNLAIVQSREGNGAEALRSLEIAAQLNPTFSKALVLHAVISGRMRQPGPSLALLDARLSERPTDVMLLGAKARLLMAGKRYEDAKATAIKGLKLDHNNPELLRVLGEIYYHLGRRGLALLALARAADIYKGEVQPPAGGVKTKPAGDVEPTALPTKKYERRAFEGGGSLRGVGSESLERDHGLAHINYVYGALSLKEEQYEEARRYFKKAVDFRPDYAEAWNNYGITWLVAKKGEEAIAAFSRALELEPTFFEARINLGNAYRVSKLPKEERAAKARAEYERCIKQRPDDPAAYFNMGIIFLENAFDGIDNVQRYEKSIEFFKAYQARRPPLRSGQKDLAKAYIGEATNLRQIAVDTRRFEEEERKKREKNEKIKALYLAAGCTPVDEDFDGMIDVPPDTDGDGNPDPPVCQKAPEPLIADPGMAAPADAAPLPPDDGTGAPPADAAPPADPAPLAPDDGAAAPPPPPADDTLAPPAPADDGGAAPPPPPPADDPLAPPPPADDGGAAPAPPPPADDTAPPGDDTAPPPPPAPADDAAPPVDDTAPPPPPADDADVPPPPPPARG
jgi:tetratricopeptide (TPR) repeat protein